MIEKEDCGYGVPQKGTYIVRMVEDSLSPCL